MSFDKINAEPNTFMQAVAYSPAGDTCLLGRLQVIYSRRPYRDQYLQNVFTVSEFNQCFTEAVGYPFHRILQVAASHCRESNGRQFVLGNATT